MRVLLATYPQKTHLMAMVPLAWALRTAGHDVRVASAPRFATHITQAGLTAVSVGSDRGLAQMLAMDHNWITCGPNGLPVPYDSAVWRPEEVTWEYLQWGYGLHVPKWHKLSNQPIFDDLVAFARAWRPDLVLWESSTYAAAVAAEACGARHGRVLFSPDVFAVTRAHYLRLASALPAAEQRDHLAEWLGGTAARHGIDFSEGLVTGQFTVTMLPKALRLDADVRYLPMRPVPYGGPAIVPGWLQEAPQRRRVAFTMGLSIGEDVESILPIRDMLTAVAQLDVEVVAALSVNPDHYPDLPRNVRLLPYVPMHALIRTCAAVVHHGGFGTLTTAVSHGVPQVVVASDADGPTLSSRVAAHRAGLALRPAQAYGSHLRDAVQQVMEHAEFRAGAQRLRDQMSSMPTPHEVVRLLEEMVTGG